MGEIVDALAAGRIVARSGATWRLGTAGIEEAAVAALCSARIARVERDRLKLTPAARHWQAGARPVFARRPLSDGDAPGGQRPARSVTVNLRESPLGWLRARGLVSARQFAAGERLAAEWHQAELAPSVTMRWDAPPAATTARGPSERLDATERQVAARRRFDAAIAAAGPGLADVLWRVVCAGEGLEAAERALGWPGRSGKVVLLIALDRVADHYRIEPVPARR